MPYIYHNLGEIAAYFEMKASQLRTNERNAKTKSKRDLFRGEAFGYEQCAYILRNSTLKEPLDANRPR